MSQPGYSGTVPGRPLGVAIIAVLLGLYGFFTLLGGILIVVLANYAISLGGLYGLTGTLLGILLIVVGLIILVVASGLWGLRMWALVLAVLVLLFEIFGPVISIAEGKTLSGSLLGLIVSILLLIYLVAVRRHFR